MASRYPFTLIQRTAKCKDDEDAELSEIFIQVIHECSSVARWKKSYNSEESCPRKELRQRAAESSILLVERVEEDTRA
jgi:uncharacterized protein (DUF1330 family)